MDFFTKQVWFIFRTHYSLSRNLQTPFPTSRILLDFERPLRADVISFLTQPLSIPPDVMKQLVQHWHQQLKDKQASLQLSGIRSEIKPFNNSTNELLDALYVNEKPVLWPGTAITLRDVKMEDDVVTLIVSDIAYPFIAALNNIAFRKNLGMESVHQLRPPLAICTFAITTDQMLVLTVRGNSTNVYPGRLYGQGGNPATTNVDIVHHQIEEMKDELLLEPELIFIDTFKFLGIIEDCEMFPGKPDLIGMVYIKLSSTELKKRFEMRSSEERPPDVVDIRLVPFNINGLNQLLFHETKPVDYCPPAHGGLMLIGMMEFGGDWKL